MRQSKLFLSVLSLVMTILFSSFSSSRLVPKGNVYDFKLKTLEGKDISLSQFKGKKLLLVNVASKCGFTSQYKNLEALSEKYAGKLVVIGFPANNFGGQEPGTADEIKTFCTKNYGVKFPMMEKISVKGSDAHPLYKYLSDKELNGTCDKSPSWNFCKYLTDEKGQVVKFFGSAVDPLSSEITELL